MLSVEKQVEKIKNKPEGIRVLDFIEQSDFGFSPGKPSDFYPHGELRELMWNTLLDENQKVWLELQSISQNLQTLQSEAFESNMELLTSLTSLEGELINYHLKVRMYLAFFEEMRMEIQKSASSFDALVEKARASNLKTGHSGRSDVMRHHLFLVDASGKDIKQVPYLGFLEVLSILGLTLTPEAYLLATYVGVDSQLKKDLTVYALGLK